ncbi:hypothetical protein [Streptomyces sp. WELS2]|uniref:hypothetical protein n=1 Tax=Streptomyces sp. WELS2 TaxID=2749435 RepID=UPI0015F0DF59|nr:hypothetical protein [Streptomyces sp. WELS2]
MTEPDALRMLPGLHRRGLAAGGDADGLHLSAALPDTTAADPSAVAVAQWSWAAGNSGPCRKGHRVRRNVR